MDRSEVGSSICGLRKVRCAFVDLLVLDGRERRMRNRCKKVNFGRSSTSLVCRDKTYSL